MRLIRTNNNPYLPYDEIIGDMVPYGQICPCNPTNGGSGICGCIRGNELVPRNGGNKTNFTTNNSNINGGINGNGETQQEYFGRK